MSAQNSLKHKAPVAYFIVFYMIAKMGGKKIQFW